MAPSIDALVIADPPEAWADAGFAVDPDGTCRVGSVRLELVGRDRGKRIVGWSLRDVSLSDDQVDGLATTTSDRPPAEPAVHANGVTVIDHLVLLSPDLDRTTAALERAGIESRRTRIVDPSQYGFEARQVFFRLDEVTLELIGPDQPNPDAADRPAGFFGLAYTVEDLDALPARYGEHIGAVKEAVQPGRRIATLRHKELGMSVATAFMTPGPDALSVT